jgi:hypothetical protein
VGQALAADHFYQRASAADELGGSADLGLLFEAEPSSQPNRPHARLSLAKLTARHEHYHSYARLNCSTQAMVFGDLLGANRTAFLSQ